MSYDDDNNNNIIGLALGLEFKGEEERARSIVFIRLF